MLNADTIFSTLVWPLLTTLAVLSLLWIPAFRKRHGVAGFVAASAMVAGTICGYWTIVGAPSLSLMPDAKTRLPLVALVALLHFAVVSRWHSPRLRQLAIASFSMMAMALILGPVISSQWTTSESLLRAGGLCLGLIVVLLSADYLQSEAPPRVYTALLAGLAGLGAPLMLFSDSLLLAQLHGALGISVAALCIVIWLVPQLVPIRGLSFVAAGLAWCLWTIALLFASTPTLSFALLASALPLAVAASYLTRRTASRWKHIGVLATVSGAIVASLVIGGLRYGAGAQADASEGDGYGYGYDYSE